MSMSVEQVMYNYQKKIERLGININFIKENLAQLLTQLQSIDVSGLNCQEIEGYLAELDLIHRDLLENELVQEFSKVSHVDLELAKRVNFFLEQKTLRLAEIQQNIENLKIRVVEDETRARLTNLQQRTNLNLDQLEQELVASVSDSNSKAIVLTFFKNNRAKLINFTPAEIAEVVKTEISNFQMSQEFVKLQYLGNFNQQIAEDKFVKAELIEDLEQFNQQDFNSQDELAATALKLQQKIINKQLDESARKHAISSILQAIKNRGFLVDANDIRLVKENEDKVVILYAKKVTGEEAIFKVYLDGRFTYKFEGYEGHAHDIDEQPFVNDLSMYDVSLSKEQNKVYLNPDKIMNQAKMAVKPKTDKK
ncbi:hypothetical protein SSYRP_v1c09650 [Spiroplasma syrphidicola EA-1]|uniref:Uncharacterized protein n=1 Tax=Spiroplasma syrphidicola EA-1 TaxID=1276229 RepID=R4U4Z4_9MOLU|nr:hypothetical protein [Spiroplasma syrphidicola]AGM26552.1 hypothetical protein SSYRP_v1c09650 [Spiroplasma syrphidicola EA-1]